MTGHAAGASGAAGAPPLRVGLTGGIACGKSTVVEVLRSRTDAIVDADRIARLLLGPESPVLVPLRARFGDEVFHPDGSVDRAALAAVVFRDQSARRDLEALLHPEVRLRMRFEADRHAADGAEIVVFDIPLLFETGQADEFDTLVVVACPAPVQLERAVARGMDEADARRRIDAQMPIDDKVARADHVIETSGTIAETRRRALEVYDQLLEQGRARSA